MGIQKLADGSIAFVCTEDDLAPYVLPHDPRSKHEPTEEERVQLKAMWSAFQALKALGWNESMYAPQDGSTFLAIEAGSTGIHECSRDEEARFWIYDGDTWPAKPILWKPSVT